MPDPKDERDEANWPNFNHAIGSPDASENAEQDSPDE